MYIRKFGFELSVSPLDVENLWRGSDSTPQGPHPPGCSSVKNRTMRTTITTDGEWASKWVSEWVLYVFDFAVLGSSRYKLHDSDQRQRVEFRCQALAPRGWRNDWMPPKASAYIEQPHRTDKAPRRTDARPSGEWQQLSGKWQQLNWLAKDVVFCEEFFVKI